MLERRHRLTSAAGFAAAVRRGRRAASRTLVVHVHAADPADPDTADPDTVDPDTVDPAVPATAEGPTRVGLIVSKAVGNAVARNRVKRRLRHLLRESVDRLPPGALVVLRALPSASGARSPELTRDQDRCLDRELEGVRR